MSSWRGTPARAGVSAPPDQARRRSVCRALRQEPLRGGVCFLLASMCVAGVKGWNWWFGRYNGKSREFFSPAACAGPGPAPVSGCRAGAARIDADCIRNEDAYEAKTEGGGGCGADCGLCADRAGGTEAG
ncbi:protein of unknown function [Burkholderia multivorans]